MSDKVCDLRVVALADTYEIVLECNRVRVAGLSFGWYPTVEEISGAASKHRLEAHPCPHPECPYWTGACPYDHQQEPAGGWEPLYEEAR